MFTKKDFLEYCHWLDSVNRDIVVVNQRIKKDLDEKFFKHQKNCDSWGATMEFPKKIQYLVPTLSVSQDGFMQFMKEKLTK